MSFIYLILEWYRKHKRDLPWRSDKKFYPVWLSEVILQQTRVNQGMSYFHAFLKQFPDIHHLAAADEQQVLKLWQGLGYYSRARNLHKTAKIIAFDLKGKPPKTYDSLKKLPGIGPYTAAAIASICFDEKVPAIDGNAYRVYARYFGLTKDISDSDAHKFYFNFALNLIPEKNPGDFNEAIMELGATVCLPQKPICEICPVNRECAARLTGKTNLLPIKTKKVKIRKRFFKFYFILNVETGKFLIEKRVGQDVWQNLFQLPMIEFVKPEKLNNYDKFKPELISEFKHILTHQHLYIKIYKIEMENIAFEKFRVKNELLAIKPTERHKYPFPKPIFSFLNDYFDAYESSE